MIRLDTTTRKLQAVLAGAVTANQLPVMVSYSDKTATTYQGATQIGNTNSTTTVDICAAPGASTVRDIDYVSVHNADTVAATVTIYFNDNATQYVICKTVLSAGDKLTYMHGIGWKVTDSTGAVKDAMTVSTAVTAQGLSSATTVVNVSASTAPLNGQVLVAQSGTSASWQTMSNPALSYTPIGGTADAITLTPNPAITSYAAAVGQRWIAAATGTNASAAVTVNVNGLGALPAYMGGVVVPVGDLIAGDIYWFLLATAGTVVIAPFDAISSHGDTMSGPLTGTSFLATTPGPASATTDGTRLMYTTGTGWVGVGAADGLSFGNGNLTAGGLPPNTLGGFNSSGAFFATSTIATNTTGVLNITAAKTFAVSNSLTLAGTDGTTMTFPPASASIGYLGLPQNSQSVAYTTVLSDAGKHILHPSADTTARIFTIDSNANVAYPLGTAITFVNQNGAGVVTIAITTDTMRLAGAGTTGSRTLAANGIATAVKVATTEWIINGTGLT